MALRQPAVGVDELSHELHGVAERKTNRLCIHWTEGKRNMGQPAEVFCELRKSGGRSEVVEVALAIVESESLQVAGRMIDTGLFEVKHDLLISAVRPAYIGIDPDSTGRCLHEECCRKLTKC